MNFQECNLIVRGYLRHYADRYNYAFPDSMPTYAGFTEWAEKHQRECSPLEKNVLDLFLNWLDKNNSVPSRRVNSLSDYDLNEFIAENLQSVLLGFLPLNR